MDQLNLLPFTKLLLTALNYNGESNYYKLQWLGNQRLFILVCIDDLWTTKYPCISPFTVKIEEEVYHKKQKRKNKLFQN